MRGANKAAALGWCSCTATSSRSGSGDAAGEIAGRMKQFGRYFALLPRTLLERRARKEN